MRMTPYLYFKGGCEEALTFYADCGLGKIVDVRRYAGTPMEARDDGVHLVTGLIALEEDLEGQLAPTVSHAHL